MANENEVGGWEAPENVAATAGLLAKTRASVDLYEQEQRMRLAELESSIRSRQITDALNLSLPEREDRHEAREAERLAQSARYTVAVEVAAGEAKRQTAAFERIATALEALIKVQP
jgi:hypothetical protein